MIINNIIITYNKPNNMSLLQKIFKFNTFRLLIILTPEGPVSPSGVKLVNNHSGVKFLYFLQKLMLFAVL